MAAMVITPELVPRRADAYFGGEAGAVFALPGEFEDFAGAIGGVNAGLTGPRLGLGLGVVWLLPFEGHATHEPFRQDLGCVGAEQLGTAVAELHLGLYVELYDLAERGDHKGGIGS